MDGSSLLFVIRSSLLNRGEGEVPTSFTSPKSVVNSEADDGRKERVSGRLRGASIMMGTKERSFAPLITMSLEELYRKIISIGIWSEPLISRLCVSLFKRSMQAQVVLPLIQSSSSNCNW
jgi:hypothetical protein